MPQVAESPQKACLLFVQIGDYGEVYRALKAGAPETYRDQRASVAFVEGLAEQMKVVVLCIQGEERPMEHLAPNLSALVIPRTELTQARIAALFDEVNPTHLLMRTPQNEMLSMAGERGIHVLPILADIFQGRTLREKWRDFKLSRALRKSGARVFSNHTLNASRSMVKKLGCDPTRVVPWDWGPVPTGGDAKPSMGDPSAPRLLFVGSIREDKGVGEVIDAVKLLRAEGIAATAQIAGPGDLELFQARIDRHGLGDCVTLLGSVPNGKARELMRQQDMVIVPSWHSYPEGLPNTIYEALASRSPLIMSDHPAFRGRLQPNQDCLVFKERDAAGLAACVKQLCAEPGLYARLSENGLYAHDSLYVGLRWGEVISAFLKDPLNSTGWAQAHSMKRFDGSAEGLSNLTAAE